MLEAAHRPLFSWGEFADPRIECQTYADPIGEPICVEYTPVQGASWAGMKALFR